MPTKVGRTVYLTLPEAAAVCGVKPDTFSSRVSRGVTRKAAGKHVDHPLPALELGGRKLFKQADVTRYVANKPGRGARTDLRKKPVR